MTDTKVSPSPEPPAAPTEPEPGSTMRKARERQAREDAFHDQQRAAAAAPLGAGPAPSESIAWKHRRRGGGGDAWNAEWGTWELEVSGTPGDSESWEWEVCGDDGTTVTTITGNVVIDTDDEKAWERAAGEAAAEARRQAEIVTRALAGATAASSAPQGGPAVEPSRGDEVAVTFIGTLNGDGVDGTVSVIAKTPAAGVLWVPAGWLRQPREPQERPDLRAGIAAIIRAAQNGADTTAALAAVGYFIEGAEATPLTDDAVAGLLVLARSKAASPPQGERPADPVLVERLKQEWADGHAGIVDALDDLIDEDPPRPKVEWESTGSADFFRAGGAGGWSLHVASLAPRSESWEWAVGLSSGERSEGIAKAGEAEAKRRAEEALAVMLEARR